MNILGLLDVPVWLLLLVAILILIYVLLTWNYDTFKKMGVPGPKPYPLVGTMMPMFTKFTDMKMFDRYIVEKYGKIVGVFEGNVPVLVVTDAEMLKQIFVKDFANFTNRQELINKSVYDPPFDKMLNVLTDDHWKHVRNLCTPTFTSGKLKKMIPGINICCEQLVENLKELAEKNEDIQLRDIIGFCSLDVIARVAFGLHLNTQKDQDNDFAKMAKKSEKSGKSLSVAICVLAPWLVVPLKKIGFSLFDEAPGLYFSKVVKQAIEVRKATDLGNKDFLQLMMKAHVNKPTEEDMQDEELKHSMKIDEGNLWSTKGLTEEEIISQAVIFLLAGFGTTSDTLMWLCYELAINPESQEKLIEEVDDVTEGEAVTAENVNKLEYVEMCIMETLRKYPPSVRTNREVGRDNVMIGGVKVPKGLRIDIPMCAIHYDPEIYPEPHKFIPERFTAAERQRHNPYDWIPFGYGPRNCIALRFAMLEMKVVMARIAQKMRLVKCENTEVPVKIKHFYPATPIKIRANMRKLETKAA